MNKTIIISLSMLILMFAVIVNADVISSEKIDDTGIFTQSDTTQCEYYSADGKFYCFGLPSGQTKTIWTYELSTGTIENKTALMPSTNFWNNNNALWYYDDKMWAYSSTGAFSYDIIGDSVTNLTGIPDFDTGTVCCDVNNGTDDVYCIGGDTNNEFFIKYEMDTGVNTTLQTPTGVSSSLLMADMCDFDETNNKLYWLRTNYDSTYGFNVYSYDIAGNTHSLVGTLPNITSNPDDPTYEGFRNGVCDYVEAEDTLYCYAGDDDSYMYDEIFSMDITGGIGSISSTFMYQNISYSSCSRINATESVCLGGYETYNFDSSDDVFMLTFTAPVEQPPQEEGAGGLQLTNYTQQHSSSDVAGVVIDFVAEYGIAMIGLVSLIVVGGLLIFSLNRIKVTK